ncbi:Ankyrin repeat and BTB/POZ domain-containing protein 1 [Pleodorina starrii]|nr:Ankyrin repeat and BTB/POZ domain-containing protein 1 [Pleodorina starrii]GLC76518.1 Ankyrin repeat and BTB/POZ domain-containing protein 1 [Pleodorina starrii]
MVLRRLDSAAADVGGSGAVTTRLTGAVEGYTLRQMAILPGGELAVDDFFKQVLVIVSGDGDGDGDGDGGFKPSSEALAGRVAAATATAGKAQTGQQEPLPVAGTAAAAEACGGLLDFLVAAPGGDGGAGQGGGSSGGGGGAAATAAGIAAATVTVTVNVGDGDGGRAFVVHRAVLTARSEYFKKRLLAAGEDSSRGCVDAIRLPDADPEAFGFLLVYMYTGELVVPDVLLRPAVELAAQLRLPAECAAQLQARLLAGVTPGSVVSELVWAEQHGLTKLVTRLQEWLVQRRREVVAATGSPTAQNVGLSELISSHPELTAELVLQLLTV